MITKSFGKPSAGARGPSDHKSKTGRYVKSGLDEHTFNALKARAQYNDVSLGAQIRLDVEEMNLSHQRRETHDRQPTRA